MNNNTTVLAIVGSYRKGGNIDAAVEEVLKSARTEGATTRKIYLIDQHIEFCTNCRTCAQEPGTDPGKCIHHDDMESVLHQIRQADALILASPVNFGTVTAVTKRFIERLICLAYWPWGMKIPKKRSSRHDKPAVIIASSAAPALMLRWSGGTMKILRQTTGLLSARPIGELCIGLVAQKSRPDLSASVLRQANRLGRRLVAQAHARAASAA